jgi:hypothetical protein
MNRLDLIIDALEGMCGDRCNTEYNLCQASVALAAARELKALKPVAWQNLHLPDEFYDAELLDPSWYSHYRPLYALDEVTK